MSLIDKIKARTAARDAAAPDVAARVLERSARKLARRARGKDGERAMLVFGAPAAEGDADGFGTRAKLLVATLDVLDEDK